MIAGCMRIYPGSLPTLKYALRQLVRQVDRLYILLHNTKIPEDIVLPIGSVVEEWEGEWNHGYQLNAVFHMTDQDRPDWVLIPDSDEILPAYEIGPMLQLADTMGKQAVSFPYAVPWDGFRYQIDPDLVMTGDHVKAVRWDPYVDFNEVGGFCVPMGYWERIQPSYVPLLHLYCLTKEIRDMRRYMRTLDSFALDENPRLIPAPDNWKEYEL
jgi:hypothetical protein